MYWKESKVIPQFNGLYILQLPDNSFTLGIVENDYTIHVYNKRMNLHTFKIIRYFGPLEIPGENRNEKD